MAKREGSSIALYRAKHALGEEECNCRKRLNCLKNRVSYLESLSNSNHNTTAEEIDRAMFSTQQWVNYLSSFEEVWSQNDGDYIETCDTLECANIGEDTFIICTKAGPQEITLCQICRADKTILMQSLEKYVPNYSYELDLMLRREFSVQLDDWREKVVAKSNESKNWRIFHLNVTKEDVSKKGYPIHIICCQSWEDGYPHVCGEYFKEDDMMRIVVLRENPTIAYCYDCWTKKWIQPLKFPKYRLGWKLNESSPRIEKHIDPITIRFRLQTSRALEKLDWFVSVSGEPCHCCGVGDEEVRMPYSYTFENGNVVKICQKCSNYK